MLAASVFALAAGSAAQGLDDLKGQPGLPGQGGGSPGRFSAKAIVSHKVVAPGGSFHLAVEMTVADDTWLYGVAPAGTVVRPVALKVQPGPSELHVGRATFSPTGRHRTDYPDGRTDVHNVYEGKGYLFLPVTVPANARPGLHELSL